VLLNSFIMSIPLDRLYYYIENIAKNAHQDRVIIYRFFPHGSKNIENLKTIETSNSPWFDSILYPAVWCHDQEPLNYEFYSKNPAKQYKNAWRDVLTLINKNSFTSKNLNHKTNIFDKGLLLHSEKRSAELVKYQVDNELIPVYYCSHAVIALDWFRYAQHEHFQKNVKKTFLIYNRAWAGTREYRLKFIDSLIENNLLEHCQTTVNPLDPELSTHYKNYRFENANWQPTNILEHFLPPTTADSSSSADFVATDYNSTEIEVVLETLFDDARLHLTEKSFRPIACSQPFILAATHGSLEYLRSYGFKTFGHIWDERYDLIEDPQKRLQAIVDVMNEIASWPDTVRKTKLQQAKEIAKFNRQWFFSQEFFDLIETELKNNLELAFNKLASCDNYQRWYTWWTELLTYSEVVEFLNTNQDKFLPTKNAVDLLIKICETRLGLKKIGKPKHTTK
jgi:hypothetical protein